jgi:tetratricopeptide (TPR) repeat protein
MNTSSNVPEWLTEAREHLAQAYSHYEDGHDFAEGLAACDAALTLDPDNADALNLRGVLLEELDRPGEAREAYREALRLNHNFSEARDNLAALNEDLDVDPELVTVAVASWPAAAHILKGRLETEGIPAVLVDEEMVAVNWLMGTAIGWIKVKVAAEFSEEAMAILGTELATEEEWDDEDVQEAEEAGETAEATEAEQTSDAADEVIIEANAEEDVGEDAEELLEEEDDWVAERAELIPDEAALTEAAEALAGELAEDDTDLAEMAAEVNALPLPEVCPECGWSNIRYEKYANRWVYAAWLVIAFPLPFQRREWRCRACGHRWRVEVEATEPEAAAS